MMQKSSKFLLAWLVTFVLIEATAALWHLLLFREQYAEWTHIIDRGSPTEDYIIPHLMATNVLRSLVIVIFFGYFSKGVLRHIYKGPDVELKDGAIFGLLLGTVSALMAVEYYGIWKISSFAWVAMEGGWAILQGLAYGLGLGAVYRTRT